MICKWLVFELEPCIKAYKSKREVNTYAGGTHLEILLKARLAQQIGVVDFVSMLFIS